MILRSPTFLDFEFIRECYADWPRTELNPPILDCDVRDWINRWMNRSDEVCRIAETNRAVGLITYRRGGGRGLDMSWAVVVDRLLVHPTERRKGYANQIVRTLRDELVNDGVTVAYFEAMTGPIADQIERGKFVRLGESEGKSGVLVHGQLTADMDV